MRVASLLAADRALFDEELVALCANRLIPSLQPLGVRPDRTYEQWHIGGCYKPTCEVRKIMTIFFEILSL